MAKTETIAVELSARDIDALETGIFEIISQYQGKPEYAEPVAFLTHLHIRLESAHDALLKRQ